MKSFFRRLRERQHLRKLLKERNELIAPKPQWDDTRARVRWLNAQLALALKNNDRAEIERLTPICMAAREEFTAAQSNPKVTTEAGLRKLIGVR